MVFSVIAIAVLMLITAPIMANHTFARSTTVSGKLVKVPPNVRPHPAFGRSGNAVSGTTVLNGV